MDEITEDFPSYLARITRLLVTRLVIAEGNEVTLLAQINMTARLIHQLERHLRLLIVAETDHPAEALLDEVLNPENPRERSLTWKEVGDALGVSPQAAHRKYAPKAEKNDS
ncbi:hypothetical protein ACFFMN_15875 [Planobispora siamensis]|uniref:Uncharacterized protein n=1 Tax=Planobispora siamensis TaxID=936338 RepID=A0A8J3WMY1_9ACTN|nr:hypothetical protein [Planobispora siamensis]GIH93902.1 hypothetical protein Psi01_45320 [Planobispora siamensis]